MGVRWSMPALLLCLAGSPGVGADQRAERPAEQPFRVIDRIVAKGDRLKYSFAVIANAPWQSTEPIARKLRNAFDQIAPPGSEPSAEAWMNAVKDLPAPGDTASRKAKVLELLVVSIHDVTFSDINLIHDYLQLLNAHYESKRGAGLRNGSCRANMEGVLKGR